MINVGIKIRKCWQTVEVMVKVSSQFLKLGVIWRVHYNEWVCVTEMQLGAVCIVVAKNSSHVVILDSNYRLDTISRTLPKKKKPDSGRRRFKDAVN